MDRVDRQALKNPATSANIFSRLVSQSWMNGLFRKGHRDGLEDSDIYEVFPRDSTGYLTDKLQRYWEHELKSSKNPSLVLPIVKLAGIRYMSLIVYVVLELAVRIIQPIYIGKIVAVFQDGVEENKADGYIYATIIAIGAFSESLLHHPLFLELLRTGMNIRVAVSALVYRKVLRMSQVSLGATNTGQIVNLVTNDVQKFEEASLFSLYLFVAPFLLAVACYFFWIEVGYSFIPGMGLLFLLTPLQAWIGRFFAALRAKTAILRDERIKIMNEVISGMRVIKMYTWEHPFAELVRKVRSKETNQIVKTSRLYSLNSAFYLAAIPMVTMAMFIPYALTGNTLTSDKVFTVIAIIASVNTVTVIFIPKAISSLRESGVSLSRIEKFLELEEGTTTTSLKKTDEEQHSVIVKNVYSSWNEESEVEALSDVTFEVSTGELLMVVGPVGGGKSSLLMALLRELPVKSGEIHLSGSVAYVSQQPWVFSGTLKENILFGREYDKKKYDEVIRVCALKKDIKTLVHEDETLVGERGVSLSGGQKARVNLARAVYLDANIYLLDDPLSAVDSHVSRHIFDECIRGVLKSKVRILVSHQLQFLDEADRVLCLHKGKVVGYGDMKSLQNQQIDVFSMIRVVEKDDEKDSIPKDNGKVKEPHFPIRKVERHLSHSPTKRRKINHMENTRSFHGLGPETDPLLAVNESTLNDQYKARSAHDLGKDLTSTPVIAFGPFTSDLGRVTSLDTKPMTSSFMSIGASQMDIDLLSREDVVSQEDNEELAEGRATGSITWKVYKDYFLAGARPAAIFVCFAIFLSGQASLMLCEWWLAKWSDWEESQLVKNNSQSIIKQKRTENISIYVALVGCCFLLAFTRATLLFRIFINSSRNLHNKMFNVILRAPIYFFDTNPVGRILNRFSKDVGLMDDMLPTAFFDASQLSVLAMAIVLMTISSQPYVSIAVVPIVLFFVWLRQYFIKTSRDIKRLEALSRSPLYSHISATLQGLTTIRASREQQQFLNNYNKFQDHNSSAWFMYLTAGRWLGFRLDALCALMMSVVSFAPLLAAEAGLSISPVLVGLSLIYTKRLTGMFQFCVRQTAEVENQMVSVERVQEYTQIEPEADLEVPENKPSDKWPEHGGITGENVRFRYHSSLPTVLKDIEFNIKPKEKIGIVGRTGAGKSSLISALFRIAEPTGVLKIDGVSITAIGLHDLRSKLSIIPQDPVIFAGTVRSNLDPFADHTDLELWDALQQVQLKEVVDNFPEKLEFQLTESGSNLSVGQRQLICLARAILKHNKILIIDEATANVDHKTDHLIQETIRKRFKDCTVLTIAHRLNTIVDADRIMVLDRGKLIEFDEPYELLKNTNSAFSNMVAQTGGETSSQLQKMAQLAHEKRSCQ